MGDTILLESTLFLLSSTGKGKNVKQSKVKLLKPVLIACYIHLNIILLNITTWAVLPIFLIISSLIHWKFPRTAALYVIGPKK